jgi:hypothetical protein
MQQSRKEAFSKEDEIKLIQKAIENEKLIEQINTIISLTIHGDTVKTMQRFFKRKLGPKSRQKEIIAN